MRFITVRGADLLGCKGSRARRLPSTPMPPEALGAAHAECWRAVGEVVELEVAEGHLNAHGGPPVLIRGSTCSHPR